MARQEANVEELIGMIERGELRLPEMQRRYVWSSTRVRDLFDSLYRDYPSGAILLWESAEEVPLQDFAVEQQNRPMSTVRLLLDGQQRLTSLMAVIRDAPLNVRGRKRPIDLLFNLEHPDTLTVVTEVEESESELDGSDDADGPESDDEDEDRMEEEADSTDDDLTRRFAQMTFVIGSNRLERQKQWVRVSDVFRSDGDKDLLHSAGVTGFDDPRYDRYSSRLAKLRSIRKYVYRMDVLERTLSYDEVTEIFVRVNSLGAKLRSSDLALAQITAKWKGALDTFLQYQTSCEKQDYLLDLGIHLKNLVVFATGQSRFRTVGGLPLDTLKSAWEQCIDGMDFAINYVKVNARIDSPALLSSPFILIVLAYYWWKRGPVIATDESELLRKWTLLANAKGRYSRGSSETILDEDLRVIREGGSALDLIETLRRQVGRLDITADELAGRNQRSALFKTMFLAFREAGAKDWESSVGISLSHRGSMHRLQFHHIFPKAVLRGKVPNREIHDISNLAFIGGKTNRKIRDKPPSQYILELANKDAKPLNAQCVPSAPEVLEVSAYLKFLEERRRLICQRLNEYLGTHP